VTELERKVARLVRNLQIAHDRAERYAAPDTGSPSVVANELRWLAEDLARLGSEALRLSEWIELGGEPIAKLTIHDGCAPSARDAAAAEALRDIKLRWDTRTASPTIERGARDPDPDPVSSGSEER
jgi:hypothetical protein